MSRELLVSFRATASSDCCDPISIKCRVESPNPSELPAVALTAQIRHNLLLAAKEALNNSVRHAQAQTIWLKIRLAADCLVVEIEDDGQGFDLRKTRPGGNGLSNIKSRMELISGRAEILSLPGKGTTVTLILPLAGNLLGIH